MRRYRESVSRVVVSTALIAAVLAVVILGTGGFGTTVMGRRVSAHHPLRAAAAAEAAFCSALLSVAGDARWRSRTTIWLSGLAFFDLCQPSLSLSNASSIDMGSRWRARPLPVLPCSR